MKTAADRQLRESVLLRTSSILQGSTVVDSATAPVLELDKDGVIVNSLVTAGRKIDVPMIQMRPTYTAQI